MSDLKSALNNINDKLTGKAKEAAGKVTGNEELELKGKIQSAKADFKKKVGDLGDIKEDMIGKLNDKIDEHEDKKSHH